MGGACCLKLAPDYPVAAWFYPSPSVSTHIPKGKALLWTGVTQATDWRRWWHSGTRHGTDTLLFEQKLSYAPGEMVEKLCVYKDRRESVCPLRHGSEGHCVSSVSPRGLCQAKQARGAPQASITYFGISGRHGAIIKRQVLFFPFNICIHLLSDISWHPL